MRIDTKFDDPGDGKAGKSPKISSELGRHDMAGSIDVQSRPCPSALCFRLRPAEDPLDRANQQTAVRDSCTGWTCLRMSTVQCVVQRMTDRQEAAPEDEPEVKHELGGREHP